MGYELGSRVPSYKGCRLCAQARLGNLASKGTVCSTRHGDLVEQGARWEIGYFKINILRRNETLSALN